MQKQFGFGQHALFLIILAVLGMVLGGCGPKKQKIYHVGIVSGAPSFSKIAAGFKAKMTELGYMEGKNIIYDFHELNIDPAEFSRVIKEFVKKNVDLILTFPTEPSLVAKEITQGTNIPVVFAMAGIENNQLVAGIHYPGGNVTGVRYPSPELTGEILEMLHELAPQAERVYVAYDPKYPTIFASLPILRSTARVLGLTVVEDPVRTRNLEGLKAKLNKRASLADIGVDAMMIMPDILNNSPEGFGTIIEFADEHRLPIAGCMDFTADRGAMFSYVPSNMDQGMLAATLADKIFKGASAGTLSVITPEARLRLNSKAIQKLGLTIPESLLARAKEIIR
jgi:putative ABC transport system substrate-binding protein